MSNRRNLANGILALGVSTSDTTFVLQTGYGDGMPPAVPYELTVTPFGQLSTLGNSEIIRVTARTDDTLTVVRAQKGTAAKAFLAGAVVSNGITTDDVIGTEVTVSTAAATAAKVGTTTDGNYTPVLGDRVIVTFVNGSNVATPTLNIDGSGAKNIRLGQTDANTLTMGLGTAAGSNVKKQMWYDGTYWQLYGANDNANTTYTEISEAEITAGTASTARSISGRRAEFIVQKTLAQVRSTQVGDVFMSFRTTPGAGRLFMDGSTYDKANYPLLWALNASHPAYFASSDTLTFTLADMRERMPFGKSSNSPFTILGAKGGDKERTISIAQLPYHTHAFKYAVQGSGGGINNLYGMPYNASANGSIVSVPGEPPTTGETRTGVMGAGGGQALPIMNPHIIVNFEVVAV